MRIKTRITGNWARIQESPSRNGSFEICFYRRESLYESSWYRKAR
jgi:hypothetical protein